VRFLLLSRKNFLVILPARLVFLVGVYDHLRGANTVVKFVALGSIATLFFAMGGRVDALSVTFFGTVQTRFFAFGTLWLGSFGIHLDD
jgi:hypothetical protein